MNTKNYLRFGLAALLASGGSLAYGANQNLDTFTNGGGTLNFNSSSGVADNDAIGGNVALTDFGSLSRRAFQLTGTPGFGNFNNTVNAGLATWTPAVDGTGSATVRYTLPSATDFGVSGANYSAIELVLGTINGTGSIGIDVYPTTTAGAVARLTGTVPITFSDSNTTKLFNVSSLVGASGGTAAIWNGVRMIAFTLTSSTGVVGDSGPSSYQINNLGFNVGSSQVPEAKTMVPVIAFVGAAGLMAWRRRAAK